MLAALISVVLATVVATTVTFLPVHSWVRRLFLIVINLNPFTFGTWRNEFSRRETFLACWFLAFIAALTVFLNTTWVGSR